MLNAEHTSLRDQICAPLGLQPTEAQLAKLVGYLDLLQRWNTTYNLTAVRDRQAMQSHHLADCLAVVPSVQRWQQERLKGQTGQPRLRVLDVGSGGGLPGAVLAILLPELDVSCVDTVGKKAAFVRQVAGALALPNLHSVHGRVEQLQLAPFDLVTARAFASLELFTQLSNAQLALGGYWMAMKGKRPAGELAVLPPEIEVFHVEHLQVPGLDAERCLIWMKRCTPG